jgi:sulfur-oxidizing protein SoxA
MQRREEEAMQAMIRRTAARAALALGAATVVTVPQAQTSAVEEIAKYRAALQDGNPAELWEARGEDLWQTPRGPKSVSFATCDLGRGPGVVKGAYAQLPKYFADADRVMDLETRLVHCMVTQQGMSDADARKNPFGGPGQKSDIEALVAFVTSQSRGVKMNVALDHPKEREAFALGEKMFVYRGGPHDFSCQTCHGEDGKRIRLQDLPNLMTVAGAQKGYTTWPAYRVSQGELRTFQWRLYDCFRQQRFPELVFTSDASIALTMYLARNANGAAFDAPAIKR